MFRSFDFFQNYILNSTLNRFARTPNELELITNFETTIERLDQQAITPKRIFIALENVHEHVDKVINVRGEKII